jgi:hypothetical protein
MGPIVRDVAAFGAEVQRHAAVGGDGENEQQLLQIGTVVLVVAEGDRQRGTAEGPLLAVGTGVRPANGNRGGIVVQLVQRDAELLDHVGRHGQDQRGHIGLEQPVQGPSYAVIVEPVDLLRRQVQDVGRVVRGPFAHAIDRPSRDEQIAEQDQEGLDRRELGAAIFGRQGGAEEFRQARPPQKSIEDRQGPDGLRAEAQSSLAGLGGGRNFRRGRLGGGRGTSGRHVNLLGSW